VVRDYRDTGPAPKKVLAYKPIKKQFSFQQFTMCEDDCDNCNNFRRCLMNVLFEIRMGVWVSGKRKRMGDEGYE
jgi:hypothetical protein|tara:strand:+ start:18258 stop:18479 length:222 start_codon:yes stop_codon:yes gene_type:complete